MKKTNLKLLLASLFLLIFFSLYLHFSTNPIERYAEINPKGYLLITMAYSSWPVSSPDIIKEQMKSNGYISIKVFREFFLPTILNPHLTSEQNRKKMIENVRMKDNQNYDEAELDFMRKKLEQVINSKHQQSNP